jgi:hypothetical protein
MYCFRRYLGFALGGSAIFTKVLVFISLYGLTQIHTHVFFFFFQIKKALVSQQNIGTWTKFKVLAYVATKFRSTFLRYKIYLKRGSLTDSNTLTATNWTSAIDARQTCYR